MADLDTDTTPDLDETTNETTDDETTPEGEGGTGPEGAAPAPEGEEGEEAKKGPNWAAYSRKKAKLAAQRAEFDRARTDFQAQQQQIQTLIRDGQKAKQVLSEVERRLAEDPYSLLQERGVNIDGLLERKVKAGTPEAQIEELQKRIDGLTKKLEDKDKDREGQATAAQISAAREAAGKDFVALVRQNAAEVPALADLDDEDMIEEGHLLADRWSSEGKRFNAADVALELEKKFAKRHSKIRGSAASAAKPPAAQDTAPGKSGKPEDAKAPPRTLTNRAAAETSGKKPVRKTPAEYRKAALERAEREGWKLASAPLRHGGHFGHGQRNDFDGKRDPQGPVA